MINENSAPFLGGFIMGSWSSISLWDNITVFLQVSHTQMLEYYTFKLVGTMILGVVGGLAGMVAKDLYRYIKILFNKKKNT